MGNATEVVVTCVAELTSGAVALPAVSSICMSHRTGHWELLVHIHLTRGPGTWTLCLATCQIEKRTQVDAYFPAVVFFLAIFYLKTAIVEQ